MSVLVIAEAGVNHNGDPALARGLVEAAAAAGANIVKFQTFTARRLTTRATPKAAYQSRNIGLDESQFDMLARLELSPDAHRSLIADCNRCGIDFLSTAFDAESVAFLAALGAERFKIPSGEITNLPYLRAVGAYKKPVLLSTGMATLGEVEEAVDALEATGTARSKITVLHCTTEYPAPMDEINLRAMLTMRDSLGVAVGYSDHTAGIEIAIAATALGAQVIEKHFTLDRTLPGPDHVASLEPNELRAMVAAIRNVERSLGDGIKRPMRTEAANRPVVRKSLVATRQICAGELFLPDNLTAKRPGTGVSPMCWDDVIGRRAPRDFAEDELIEL